MTTQDTTEVPGEEQELPPDENESEEVAAPPQPSEREIELQRRLRTQGNQIATLRRTNETLAHQLTDTNARLDQLTQGFTAQQKADEERRQADVQAYLESLPADQRVREELRITREQVASLQEAQRRQAAPQARTSSQPPRQQQESPEQYQARRSREILQKAADTFDVPITRAEIESIPAEAWEDEESFERSVFQMASKKAHAPRQAADGEEDQDVPKKDKNGSGQQTPAQIAETARKSVLRDLGVSSPASPRAAGTRRGAPPTADDVKASVQTYDSRSGPKGNIARLKKLREGMPEPS